MDLRSKHRGRPPGRNIFTVADQIALEQVVALWWQHYHALRGNGRSERAASGEATRQTAGDLGRTRRRVNQILAKHRLLAEPHQKRWRKILGAARSAAVLLARAKTHLSAGERQMLEALPVRAAMMIGERVLKSEALEAENLTLRDEVRRLQARLVVQADIRAAQGNQNSPKRGNPAFSVSPKTEISSCDLRVPSKRT